MFLEMKAPVFAILFSLTATAFAFAPSSLTTRSSSPDVKLFAGNDVSIEYCTGCRWMLRSSWMAQELLTTFEEELDTVTLVPSRPPAAGGAYCVTCKDLLIWDRKAEGGFPEAKELKQRVRNLVSPDKDLGHSEGDSKVQDCADCPPAEDGEMKEIPGPNVAITYCTGCKWLYRAAWMAQELMTTFDEELNSISLIPGRAPEIPGGTFTVALDGKVIWDRKEEGRFPEPKELKQIIRDVVNPEKHLGHSDISADDSEELVNEISKEIVSDVQQQFDDMDDDEADEMKKYFGVF